MKPKNRGLSLDQLKNELKRIPGKRCGHKTDQMFFRINPPGLVWNCVECKAHDERLKRELRSMGIIYLSRDIRDPQSR
jgi:hypothetical protein